MFFSLNRNYVENTERKKSLKCDAYIYTKSLENHRLFHGGFLLKFSNNIEYVYFFLFSRCRLASRSPPPHHHHHHHLSQHHIRTTTHRQPSPHLMQTGYPPSEASCSAFLRPVAPCKNTGREPTHTPTYPLLQGGDSSAAPIQA